MWTDPKKTRTAIARALSLGQPPDWRSKVSCQAVRSRGPPPRPFVRPTLAARAFESQVSSTSPITRRMRVVSGPYVRPRGPTPSRWIRAGRRARRKLSSSSAGIATLFPGMPLVKSEKQSASQHAASKADAVMRPRWMGTTTRAPRAWQARTASAWSASRRRVSGWSPTRSGATIQIRGP